MTTFSKTNFKSLNYNSFRPHYPPSFYKILADFVTKVESPLPINLPIDKTIDLGCGTGVATYPLLNISTNVIGVDLSSKMIETANSLIEKNLQTLSINNPTSTSRIKFITGSVEEFVKQQQQQNKDHNIASTLEPNSIDLITAAQCIHWFQDYDSFFQNCHQLLKNDTGVLAYFFYNDPKIVGFSVPAREDIPKEEILKLSYQVYKKRKEKTKEEILKLSYQVYNKYVYDDDNYIGQYWEQPGRNILKHFCQQVNEKIPRDLYTDIVINTFKPSIEKNNSGNTSIANEEVDLDLKKIGISIQDYIDYISTYSGFHNYKEVTGNDDLLTNEFVKELIEVTGWDLEKTKIDLVWNTGYTFIRKRKST
ncbi:hypothetical protein MGE_01010 [Candida albicans P75010]|nr:hypothetical protein MGE_01010 [Candida albicans P75010]